MDLVETLRAEVVDDSAGDGADVAGRGGIGHIGVFGADDRIVTQKPVAALPAHDNDFYLAPLVTLLLDEGRILPQYIGIEAAGQPAIGRNQDNPDPFYFGSGGNEGIHGARRYCADGRCR